MISKNGGNKDNSTTYTFGEFHLEAENLLLLKDAEVVPLAPKAAEVLRALIEADGKMLTRQQILDMVWNDSFVEEANLTHHISALRKALGEDKNGRKFIETIPRRGYRFVAAINELSNDSTEISINEQTTARAIEEIEIEKNLLDFHDLTDAKMLHKNSKRRRSYGGNQKLPEIETNAGFRRDEINSRAEEFARNESA